MRVYEVNFQQLKEDSLQHQERVLCIGTFDGVHLGHQKLFYVANELAKARGYRLCVITFKQHPLKLLSPNDAPKLLTTTDEKLQLLSQLGVDECLLIDFNEEVANTDAEEFCKIVADAIGVRVLVMGENSSIGKGGSGKATTLYELSRSGRLKMDVVVVEPQLMWGEPISSSRIREELLRGRVKVAQKMLGRAYSICGFPVAGKGLGRQLGFPTLNLHIDEEKLLPRFGVYVGLAEVRPQNIRLPMVANIGVRPTFGGEKITVEAHIIDAHLDVAHHEEIALHLFFYLRPERRFQGIDELREQIAKDVERARKLMCSKVVEGMLKR
jgi:riboflavin kinase/FMN adenylyltransferase